MFSVRCSIFEETLRDAPWTACGGTPQLLGRGCFAPWVWLFSGAFHWHRHSANQWAQASLPSSLKLRRPRKLRRASSGEPTTPYRIFVGFASACTTIRWCLLIGFALFSWAATVIDAPLQAFYGRPDLGVSGPGGLRALGFAFSGAFHGHRHSADKWADRAGSALPGYEPSFGGKVGGARRPSPAFLHGRD